MEGVLQRVFWWIHSSWLCGPSGASLGAAVKWSSGCIFDAILNAAYNASFGSTFYSNWG